MKRWHFILLFFIQINYFLEAIAVQSEYRDLGLKRGLRLLLGLEFWFLLPSLLQFNEGYFNYIHKTQGFILLDCPVFLCRWFSMLFSGLRQRGAVCRFPLASKSLGKLPEIGGSEMIGALNLIKQLGIQSGIKAGLLIMNIILIPTTSSCSAFSSQHYTKQNLYWVVLKTQNILSFDSLTLLC